MRSGNGNHKTRTSASEYGVIWSQYINDSLSCCILRHFLYWVEDKEIKEVLTLALELSESHLKSIKHFLKNDDYPVPLGFTEEDVNVNAPRLFTDTFMLVYINIMAIHGMTRYTGALGTSTRQDYMDYFTECTSQTMDLYKKSTTILLQKGILSKAPVLNNHQQVDFIKKQSFLTGWLGDRRPINSVEISGTYLNLQKTMAKMVLELGFRQVSRSKEVRHFMDRGRQVCQKHFDLLSSMLKEDHLSVPRTFETEVTDSLAPPFSDKLMLYHIVTLLSSAIGYYGEALAVSQRRDMAAVYFRMMTEIGVLAEDGMNLLIKNGWVEQPPGATDYDHLKNQK